MGVCALGLFYGVRGKKLGVCGAGIFGFRPPKSRLSLKYPRTCCLCKSVLL